MNELTNFFTQQVCICTASTDLTGKQCRNVGKMKKIMIFIEGTTFYTRPVLFLFSRYGYRPIGKAREIINALYEQGNEIYLCSYVRDSRSRFIRKIMDHYGVRYTDILCRNNKESYSDLVEQLCPDILIEDDCSSIGGEKKWCITGVNGVIRANIKSVIVREFGGIDHLKAEFMQGEEQKCRN